MKKVIFTIIGIIYISTVFSQGKDKPIEFNAKIQYPKTQVYTPNYDRMANALKQRQARYDANEKYIDNLIDWIYKLKSQTNEKQFLTQMDKKYQKLRSFDGKDLSLLGGEIRNVELSIKEEIDKYNQRIKELNNPDKYWKAANRLRNEGKFNEALEQYSMVIELTPNFEGSYLNRGYCYYSLQNYSKAISDLTQYIELKPYQEIGYHWRGWAKYYSNDYYGSLKDFNKQIEISPRNSQAYYNRGSAKSKLKDYYGSIKDYRKAIELQPDFSMAYNNIAWSLFLQKKYSEGLKEINKAIELDNKNYVAWDTRAEIKLNLRDYRGCIKDSNKAIELNSRLANSYFLKGKALYKLGEKNNACIEWSKAGELGRIEAYTEIANKCSN